MSPMQLKQPTRCCGTSMLLWIPAKCSYMCPCGAVKTDMNGVQKTNRTKSCIIYSKKFNKPKR